MKKNYLFLILLAFITFLPQRVTAQISSEYYQTNSTIITPSSSPNIIFPVQGLAIFSDDFGDGRSGGRLHEGNDLMAPKMTPVIAAQSGRITSAATTEPSYGFMLSVLGDDGYKYNYLHLNNDTIGTDDGLGGYTLAYAAGIERGSLVTQGQVIAYVGDSGNAESTASHLHFEIRLPDDIAINPYPYLNAALNISTYSLSAAQAASPNINFDKGLVVATGTTANCSPGSLIRTPLVASVYYCGADGKRYVFPNLQTYNTWYDNFSGVETVSVETMAKIMLGGNVTYRPGIKLVKIQTDSRVYAVDLGGTLRLVVTPEIAEKYYGALWNKNVEDIPDAFFTNYKLGQAITN